MEEIKIEASKLIEEYHKEYASYMVNYHFPHIIDGLKVVHRRILWSLQDVLKPISSINLLSKSFIYHYHGTESTYATMIRLAQPFFTNPPLMYFSSKIGSYGKPDKYGAYRYTAGCITQFAKDIFLSTDKRVLKYVLTEDLSGYEPKYLIPKIPTTLLYSFNNVGFGYKHLTFPFTLKSIIEFTKDFLSVIDNVALTIDKKTIVSKLKASIKKLKPNVHGNQVLNLDEIHKGIMRLEPNLVYHFKSIYKVDKNKIIVKTVVPTKTPEKLKEKILNAFKNKKGILYNYISDFKPLLDGINYLNYIIKIKRGKDVNKVLKEIQGYLECKVTTLPYYSYNDMLIYADVLDLMLYWYKERVRAKIFELKHELNDIQEKIYRIKILLRLLPYIQEVIKLLREKPNNEELRKALSQKPFNLSRYQLDIFLKFNIRDLSRAREHELKEELIRLEKQRDQVLQLIRQPHKVIYDEITQIEKKYCK